MSRRNVTTHGHGESARESTAPECFECLDAGAPDAARYTRGLWLQCYGCQKWYHGECADISTDALIALVNPGNPNKFFDTNACRRNFLDERNIARKEAAAKEAEAKKEDAAKKEEDEKKKEAKEKEAREKEAKKEAKKKSQDKVQEKAAEADKEDLTEARANKKAPAAAARDGPKLRSTKRKEAPVPANDPRVEAAAARPSKKAKTSSEDAAKIHTKPVARSAAEATKPSSKRGRTEEPGMEAPHKRIRKEQTQAAPAQPAKRTTRAATTKPTAAMTKQTAATTKPTARTTLRGETFGWSSDAELAAAKVLLITIRTIYDINVLQSCVGQKDKPTVFQRGQAEEFGPRLKKTGALGRPALQKAMKAVAQEIANGDNAVIIHHFLACLGELRTHKESFVTTDGGNEIQIFIWLCQVVNAMKGYAPAAEARTAILCSVVFEEHLKQAAHEDGQSVGRDNPLSDICLATAHVAYQCACQKRRDQHQTGIINFVQARTPRTQRIGEIVKTGEIYQPVDCATCHMEVASGKLFALDHGEIANPARLAMLVHHMDKFKLASAADSIVAFTSKAHPKLSNEYQIITASTWNAAGEIRTFIPAGEYWKDIATEVMSPMLNGESFSFVLERKEEAA